MAQHDYNIANQTFPNTRSDINNALSAVASNNSGTAAPSTTFANQWFYETDTNLLQIRNEDNDAYITIAELDQSNDTVEYFKSDTVRTTKVEFTDGDDAITIVDAGAITINTSDEGGVVFNETRADVDFRVESNANINCLHVDGGNSSVGINTTGPSDATLEIHSSVPIIKLQDTDDSSFSRVYHSAGNLLFDGDKGNGVDDSFIQFGLDDVGIGKFHSNRHFSVGVNLHGRSPLEVTHTDTGSIPTGGNVGATASDDNISLGIHNTSNSATFCGIGLETRTTGAARIALLNQHVSTYIGDLDFQFRNGASANQNHAKFRASGEGEFYFGTELATEGTSPVNPVASNTGSNEGFAIFAGSYMVGAINANPVMYLNRMTDDGIVLRIRGQGSDEGGIQVSGSSVSILGFTGTHWSRLEDNSKPTILRGTILESIDKMMDWYQVSFTDQSNQNKVYSIDLPEGGKVGDDYEIADPFFTETKYEEVDIFYTEEDENIPEGKKIGDRKPNMGGKSVGDIKDAKPIYTGKIVLEDDIKHTYSKVSDTVDSKNIYGVFQGWDEDQEGDDDNVNDFTVAQVGTFVIRVNKDVTVEAGDLLVSNGDGTAKLQDDDIIRSKTVAKVNSNVKIDTYDDGSYTVPCTLHC